MSLQGKATFIDKNPLLRELEKKKHKKPFKNQNSYIF